MSQTDINIPDDVILANLGPAFAEFDNLGMDEFELERLDDILTESMGGVGNEDRLSDLCYDDRHSRSNSITHASEIERRSSLVSSNPPVGYSSHGWQQSNTASHDGVSSSQAQSSCPPRLLQTAADQSSHLQAVPVLFSAQHPVQSVASSYPSTSSNHVLGTNDLTWSSSEAITLQQQHQQLQQLLMLQKQEQLKQHRMMTAQPPPTTQPKQFQNHRPVAAPISCNGNAWSAHPAASSCGQINGQHRSTASSLSQNCHDAAVVAGSSRSHTQSITIPGVQHVVNPDIVNSTKAERGAAFDGSRLSASDFLQLQLLQQQQLLLQQQQQQGPVLDSNLASYGDWTNDSAFNFENFDEVVLENLLHQIAENDRGGGGGGGGNSVQGSCGAAMIHRNRNQPTSTSTVTLGSHSNAQLQQCGYPDTPPESGSEPYSPPESRQMYSDKSNNDHNSPSMAVYGDVPTVHIKQSLSPPCAGGEQCMMIEQERLHGNHPSNPALVCSDESLATKDTNNSRLKDCDGSSVELDPRLMISQYESVSHRHKKRKHSTTSANSAFVSPSVVNDIKVGVTGVTNTTSSLVKPEPAGTIDDCDEEDVGGGMYDTAADGSACQVIKWTNHTPTQWSRIADDTGKDVMIGCYRVDADKGFNFSSHDDVFVCQKKNHFQITVHIGFSAMPQHVCAADGSMIPIEGLYVHFYGIKTDSPTQRIKIEQSQADRTRKTLAPYRVEMPSDQLPSSKVVVGRLHFSETTTNNMRKRGRPNPDQRYFQLVVALFAHSIGGQELMLTAHVSDRIIVRASNPGQFDGDPDSPWNKGRTPDTIYHCGNVGINTDSPDEALTVHGNIRLTGHVVAPSDIRIKKDMKEMDTSEQLKNISQMKVYQYEIRPEFAKYAGLSDDETMDTGVLAQEVSAILPDAVHTVGDVHLPDGEIIENLLVVNKDRIFIENIGAVKELCKVTDHLETRISHIEHMNKKLTKLNFGGSFKSTCSTVSSSSSSSSTPPQSHHHHQHHHRHHHNRSLTEEERKKLEKEKMPCNNRVVQILIVVLVLIMATCLATITALYLLDRTSVPSISL